MNKNQTKKELMSSERIRKARKNFDRIQKEIAPFVKTKKVKEFTTAGDWCDTSCLDV